MERLIGIKALTPENSAARVASLNAKFPGFTFQARTTDDEPNKYKFYVITEAPEVIQSLLDRMKRHAESGN